MPNGKSKPDLIENILSLALDACDGLAHHVHEEFEKARRTKPFKGVSISDYCLCMDTCHQLRKAIQDYRTRTRSHTHAKRQNPTPPHA